MRIAIMGSGGIGGFLGARLVVAGHDVIFIARGPHLEALQKKGLALRSPEGDRHIFPVQATDNTENIVPVDVILFCVKLYDTDAAARACLPLMTADSFILTLQNGVESVDMISRIVGDGRTLGGAIYVSASIEAPGVIRHSGGNNQIHFAEPHNRPSGRTAALERIFREAGLQGLRAANMQQMLWTKFILLSANAGIGALTDSGAATLCADPDSRAVLLAAMHEACDVATALGVDLPENTVEDVLNVILAAGPNQDLIASQCLDLRAGKRLELDWIQGTLQRLGKAHNIPTPVTSTVYVALKRFMNGKP